jgi:Flp pilus assembly protein TadD
MRSGPTGLDRAIAMDDREDGIERQRAERGSAYDLYSRGRSMLSGGHPHQAAMLLSQAKLLEPEKASIREALGRALFACGRATRARREFAKAVQLDPSDDYAHFALALACERTGQRTRARGHAKLAVVLRPGVPEYARVLERLTA